MRSTFFVILSLLVHALCVAAIAIAPAQITAPEGAEVEVEIGEPAELPGLEEAPEGITEASAPLTPEPIEVAKRSNEKTKVVVAPMEKVMERKPQPKQPKRITQLPPKKAITEEPAEISEPVQASVSEESLDPELEEATELAPVSAVSEEPEFIPVKETAPAGVEAYDAEAEKDAASSGEAQGETPTQDATTAKGGATKAGAISYLNLKQLPGNRSPQYPLSARKHARQGSVELLYRVTSEGKVADLQIAKSSGHKDLDLEAARAVAQFRFIPGQEGWARHPVAFSLKGQPTELPSRLRSAQAE